MIVFSLLLGSCAGHKKELNGRIIPKNVVVLPVDNQSRDLTAPILIRYFLERELIKRKFNLVFRYKEVERELRQMGIFDGSQISQTNIQQAGQILKADGIFHATLLEFRQDPSDDRTVIRAKFQFTEVMTGRTLWSKEIELQKKGLVKIPIKGIVTADWPIRLIRSIAKGKVGKLPRKLVKEALKTLPR